MTNPEQCHQTFSLSTPSPAPSAPAHTAPCQSLLCSRQQLPLHLLQQANNEVGSGGVLPELGYPFFSASQQLFICMSIHTTPANSSLSRTAIFITSVGNVCLKLPVLIIRWCSSLVERCCYVRTESLYTKILTLRKSA